MPRHNPSWREVPSGPVRLQKIRPRTAHCHADGFDLTHWACQRTRDWFRTPTLAANRGHLRPTACSTEQAYDYQSPVIAVVVSASRVGDSEAPVASTMELLVKVQLPALAMEPADTEAPEELTAVMLTLSKLKPV